MARIFLSYRREDTAGHAGRIFDHLTRRFGKGRVFMDVEGIDAGENFERAIERSIASCDTVVAVIGPRWAGDSVSGNRRIDDPTDYVRQEIEITLRLGIELVPALVGGALPPSKTALPDSIAELSLLNAHNIDDRAFVASLTRLITALEKAAARSLERRQREHLQKLEGKINREQGYSFQSLASRLVILKAPSNPILRVAVLLFYVVLLALLLTTPLLWSVSDNESRITWMSMIIAAVVLRTFIALGSADSVQRVRVLNGVRYALLFYAPVHRAAWVLHAIFYLSLFGAIIGVFVSAQGNLTTEIPTAATLMAVVLLLRGLVFTVEPDRTASRVMRWWLLYQAPQASISVLHVLFLVLLLFLIMGTFSIVSLMAVQSNDATRLVVEQSWLCLAITTFILREIAAAHDPLRPDGLDPNWFSRFFFLSIPARNSTWLPRVIFYGAIFAFFVVLPGTLTDASGKLRMTLEDNVGSIVIAVMFLLLAVTARGWAVGSDGRPVHPGVKAPTGQVIREMLLLNAPRRGEDVLLRVLFWLLLVFALDMVAEQGTAAARLHLEPYAWRFIGGIAMMAAVSAHQWARHAALNDGEIEVRS